MQSFPKIASTLRLANLAMTCAKGNQQEFEKAIYFALMRCFQGANKFCYIFTTKLVLVVKPEERVHLFNRGERMDIKLY